MRINSYSASIALSAGAASLLVAWAPEYTIKESRVWTGAALFTLTLLYRFIYAGYLYPEFLTPFKHIPTPKGRSIWRGNFANITQPPTKLLREWAATIPNEGMIRYYMFGNMERILVLNPKALSEVMTQKSYDFVKTKHLRNALSRVLGEGILLAEGEEHKVQRKNLMPAFAFRHIKDLYPTFWAKSVEMAKLIEEDLENKPAGEKVIQISHWASRATLDIIGLAGMDQDFGSLRNPDNELNQKYRQLFVDQAGLTRLLGLLSLLFGFAGLLAKVPMQRNRVINEASEFVRATARQMVRQKQEQRARKADRSVDILSVALESGGFDEESLVDQMMTFLAAGHETTATSLQWVVYALCQHPDVQARLRAEIRANLPSISAGGTPPSAADVDALPYLNAVCNEVLRYHPPVPFTIREAARDTTVAGVFVPKGAILVMSPEVTNHSTELWGPDADQFNPDRWLGPGRANSGGSTTNYALMTFFHGPRSCIGQGFTRSELACLVAVLVGRFEIELADPTKELEEKFTVTMAPKDGVMARLKVVEGW